MNVTAILAELDTEIERLQKVRDALAGAAGPAKRGPGRPKGSAKKAAKAAGKPKRILSPEARAKIAAAQKKRWAAKKTE